MNAATETTKFAQISIAACANDYVGKKHSGLCASLVGAAYPRAIGAEIERKQRAELPESNHVGEIKERLRDMRVTLAYPPQYFDSDYGTTTLLKFRDEAGNDFTWFASGCRELEVDAQFTLTGTVKKHDEYKGRKATVLTRCKLSEVEG